MLIGRSVIEPKLAQQVRFHEKAEGAVDGGATHLPTHQAEIGHKLVGIEVLMGIEDMADQHTTGRGQLLTPDLQELTELFLGAVGGGDRSKRPRFKHVSVPNERTQRTSAG